jgi:hypothetical protein
LIGDDAIPGQAGSSAFDPKRLDRNLNAVSDVPWRQRLFTSTQDLSKKKSFGAMPEKY